MAAHLGRGIVRRGGIGAITAVRLFCGPHRVLIAGAQQNEAWWNGKLSGLARNFGDVFVGLLCGGREGGVFVGGDALE